MTHTLLIADDEVNVRLALRLLVEQAGFSLSGEAEDAQGLLVQICELESDVILLDWELPGLNVPNMLATLRQHSPATEVVAFSVHQDAGQKAMAAGIDTFVSKGDPPDQLLSVLRSLKARNK